jgi:hypothetical protein
MSPRVSRSCGTLRGPSASPPSTEADDDETAQCPKIVATTGGNHCAAVSRRRVRTCCDGLARVRELPGEERNTSLRGDDRDVQALGGVHAVKLRGSRIE